MTSQYTADVAGGTEGFGAGGTGYSADHFVAECIGAGDTGYSGVEVSTCFGIAFSVGFVNFYPSLPLHALLHCFKWGSVVPKYNS